MSRRGYMPPGLTTALSGIGTPADGDVLVGGGGRFAPRSGIVLTPRNAIFGDKSDGTLVVSGVVNPPGREVFYDTLQLIAGAAFSHRGFPISCELLDVVNAPTDALQGTVRSGGNAVGTTAGAASTSQANNSFFTPAGVGVAGAAGGTTNGVAGTTNTQVNTSCRVGGIAGGPAGAGGNAGANTGGAGGVVAATSLDMGPRRVMSRTFVYAPNPTSGIGGGLWQSGGNSPSGGSGAGDGTAGGGSGGGATGGIGAAIFARRILRSSSNSNPGIISAKGGNGGNGGDPAGGNRAGGGGASGAGGGDIYIVTESLEGSVHANALDVTGGNGGNGGNKTGTGLDGNGGWSGTPGRITVINLGTGVTTVYDGAGTVPGVAPTGRIGGIATTYRGDL